MNFTVPSVGSVLSIPTTVGFVFANAKSILDISYSKNASLSIWIKGIFSISSVVFVPTKPKYILSPPLTAGIPRKPEATALSSILENGIGSSNSSLILPPDILSYSANKSRTRFAYTPRWGTCCERPDET